MKKYCFAAVLAVAAMAACTRDIEPEAPAGELMVIKAAIEDGSTRTSLSMNGTQTRADVVWNSGDQIAVIAANGSSYFYNNFTTTDDNTESQEHQQVDIGKLIDELTDGIIWRYLFQQFILMNPAEGKLVACHLHPYRVDGICRQRLDVRHNDTLMLTDGDGVLL